MTRRSLLIGLLSAFFISGFCYFHDCVMNGNGSAYIRLVPHLMPHFIYGILFLAVVLGNPFMKKVCRIKPLSRGELSMIVALSLVSCSVPFYGLVHCWPSALMMPYQYERITPGWQRENILESVPKRLLANPHEGGEYDSLTGYITGMGEGNTHVSPWDVPWRAWLPALAFWVPLALSITIASLALAAVVHWQWSKHEQLPYPISRFTQALMPGEGKGIFAERGFRVAFAIVLGIHMLNYAHAWWPEFFIPVNLRINFWPLAKLAPEIVSGDGRSLFNPRIMFAVIGISFFFASDVSFSLGIFPYIMCYIMGVMTGYGVSVARGFSLFDNTKVFLYTGGYVGVFLMCLYTGRYFYWNLFRQSIFLPGKEKHAPWLAWSLRLFFLASLCFFVLLCSTGLDWLLALAYTALAIVIYTVISRAIAEAGGFYVGTWILPGVVLMGFLGGRAIGPSALATMILVSVVILIGPGWAPMPFAIQSLKIAELNNLKLSRTTGWLIATLVICVLIALPATIYWQSDRGVMNASSGWARGTARYPFDRALRLKQHLKAVELLDSAEKVSGFGRLAEASPNPTFVSAFFIGVGLTILVSFLRLRLPWWPLHPIIFVFFGSHQAQRLAFSFLIGWMLKHAVTKYGGERMYQTCKPIMIGLVAGEMLAGAIPVFIGIIYYLITGEPAVNCSLVL